MSELRLECPHCKTSYTGERCGIALTEWQFAAATIVCMVCAKPFDVEIRPREVTEALSWWRRVVLRQQPQLTVDGHEVTAAVLRETTDGSNDVGAGSDSIDSTL
jgi:transcription elongation factor Elf1